MLIKFNALSHTSSLEWLLNYRLIRDVACLFDHDIGELVHCKEDYRKHCRNSLPPEVVVENRCVHWHVHQLEFIIWSRDGVNFADNLVRHCSHCLQETCIRLLWQEIVTVNRVLIKSLGQPRFISVSKIEADINDELVCIGFEFIPAQGEA